jgi:NHLM bacteriocin system ABC transporter ATP-binding protein
MNPYSVLPRLNLRTITANEPLLLTNSAVGWRIKSGTIAVFAVVMAEGQFVGERHFLFTVESGETLFGAEIHTTGIGLMAVALEPSAIAPFLLSEADETHCPTETLKQWIDPWIHRLGQVDGMPKTAQTGVIPEIHYISLIPGQVCRPVAGTVAWVRMQQGSAAWMGNPMFPITPDLGCFPLGWGMFLQAQDHLEFFIRPTAEVAHRKILIRGLAQLHRYFFSTLDLIAARNQRLSLKRFQQRQQLNQAVTEAVVRSLVGVLEQKNSFLDADSSLMAAVGAVGKSLGATILPPAPSEAAARVKDPLEAIARASQLRLRRVLLRGAWWQQESGPLMAYTREGRSPVALLPTPTGYELFNPAGMEPGEIAPIRIRVTAAIAQTLDPLAFVFYRPLPVSDLTAFSLLKFALRGQGRDWLVILVMGIAIALVGMVVPQATAMLVDTVLPYGDRALLAQIGLGLLAAAFGATSFQLAQAIAMLRVETRSDAILQTAVWDRLLKLPPSFYRQYSSGDLNARVSSISTIRRQLGGTVLQGLFAGLFALLNLALLFYYSPLLALVALLVALGVMMVTLTSGYFLVRDYRPLLDLQGNLYGLVVQLINGVSKLRVAGAEERAFAAWGQRYGQQLRLTLSTQQLQDAVDIFNTVLPLITTLILFGLASQLIDNTRDAELSTGTFLAFSVAFGTFISGTTTLSNTLVGLLNIVPLWERSRPILEAEPEVNLTKADPGQLSGSLKVDRVSFRYKSDGALILDQVSFEAKAGEFIALVGPSGSGKSTAMRLLLGFDRPQTGNVYYDGQDLAGLEVGAVRRQFGVVLQTSRLNAGSIFENLAGGALISLEEAWSAAEKAGLADDIRAMPMQMHTVISEGGSNLSGGQRQRLLIARALAVNPKIMLMDEATSALDNRTQAVITENLDRLKATRIVIAHRLSTIRNADRIYVIEAGRVVQQGRFEDLVAQPGLFAQLVQRQMA